MYRASLPSPVDVTTVYDATQATFAPDTFLTFSVVSPTDGAVPVEAVLWSDDGSSVRVPIDIGAVAASDGGAARIAVAIRDGHLYTLSSATSLQRITAIDVAFRQSLAVPELPVPATSVTLYQVMLARGGPLCAHAQSSAWNGRVELFVESATPVAPAIVLEGETADGSALKRPGEGSNDVSPAGTDVDISSLWDEDCSCFRDVVLEVEFTSPSSHTTLSRVDIVEASTGDGIQVTLPAPLSPVAVVSSGLGQCPMGWISAADNALKCFGALPQTSGGVSGDGFTWEEAKAVCASRGATLAIPHTLGQAAQLRRFSNASVAWFGLQANPGWTWIDGQDVDADDREVDWATGYPGDTGGCAAMTDDGAIDWGCGWKLHAAVCELRLRRVVQVGMDGAAAAVVPPVAWANANVMRFFRQLPTPGTVDAANARGTFTIHAVRVVRNSVPCVTSTTVASPNAEQPQGGLGPSGEFTFVVSEPLTGRLTQPSAYRRADGAANLQLQHPTRHASVWREAGGVDDTVAAVAVAHHSGLARNLVAYASVRGGEGVVSLREQASGFRRFATQLGASFRPAGLAFAAYNASTLTHGCGGASTDPAACSVAPVLVVVGSVATTAGVSVATAAGVAASTPGFGGNDAFVGVVHPITGALLHLTVVGDTDGQQWTAVTAVPARAPNHETSVVLAGTAITRPPQLGITAAASASAVEGIVVRYAGVSTAQLAAPPVWAVVVGHTVDATTVDLGAVVLSPGLRPEDDVVVVSGTYSGGKLQPGALTELAAPTGGASSGFVLALNATTGQAVWARAIPVADGYATVQPATASSLLGRHTGLPSGVFVCSTHATADGSTQAALVEAMHVSSGSVQWTTTITSASCAGLAEVAGGAVAVTGEAVPGTITAGDTPVLAIPSNWRRQSMFGVLSAASGEWLFGESFGASNVTGDAGFTATAATSSWTSGFSQVVVGGNAAGTIGFAYPVTSGGDGDYRKLQVEYSSHTDEPHGRAIITFQSGPAASTRSPTAFARTAGAGDEWFTSIVSSPDALVVAGRVESHAGARAVWGGAVVADAAEYGGVQMVDKLSGSVVASVLFDTAWGVTGTSTVGGVAVAGNTLLAAVSVSGVASGMFTHPSITTAAAAVHATNDDAVVVALSSAGVAQWTMPAFALAGSSGHGATAIAADGAAGIVAVVGVSNAGQYTCAGAATGACTSAAVTVAWLGSAGAVPTATATVAIGGHGIAADATSAAVTAAGLVVIAGSFRRPAGAIGNGVLFIPDLFSSQGRPHTGGVTFDAPADNRAVSWLAVYDTSAPGAVNGANATLLWASIVHADVAALAAAGGGVALCGAPTVANQLRSDSHTPMAGANASWPGMAATTSPSVRKSLMTQDMRASVVAMLDTSSGDLVWSTWVSPSASVPSMQPTNAPAPDACTDLSGDTTSIVVTGAVQATASSMWTTSEPRGSSRASVHPAGAATTWAAQLRASDGDVRLFTTFGSSQAGGAASSSSHRDIAGGVTVDATLGMVVAASSRGGLLSQYSDLAAGIGIQVSGFASQPPMHAAGSMDGLLVAAPTSLAVPAALTLTAAHGPVDNGVASTATTSGVSIGHKHTLVVGHFMGTLRLDTAASFVEVSTGTPGVSGHTPDAIAVASARDNPAHVAGVVRMAGLVNAGEDDRFTSATSAMLASGDVVHCLAGAASAAADQSVSFGSVLFTLPGVSGRDGFMVCLADSTLSPVWAGVVGATAGNDDQLTSVASGGGILVAGGSSAGGVAATYGSSAMYSGGVGSRTLATVYVLSPDDGAAQWGKAFGTVGDGGVATTHAVAVHTDRSGSAVGIVFGGAFSGGTLQLGTTLLSPPAGVTGDTAFIAYLKLADASLVWARAASSSGQLGSSPFSAIRAMATSSAAVIAAGSFQYRSGTLQWDTSDAAASATVDNAPAEHAHVAVFEATTGRVVALHVPQCAGDEGCAATAVASAGGRAYVSVNHRGSVAMDDAALPAGVGVRASGGAANGGATHASRAVIMELDGVAAREISAVGGCGTGRDGDVTVSAMAGSPIGEVVVVGAQSGTLHGTTATVLAGSSTNPHPFAGVLQRGGGVLPRSSTAATAVLRGTATGPGSSVSGGASRLRDAAGATMLALGRRQALMSTLVSGSSLVSSTGSQVVTASADAYMHSTLMSVARDSGAVQWWWQLPLAAGAEIESTSSLHPKPTARGQCPAGWSASVSRPGVCFIHASSTSVLWPEADSLCRTMGARLASVTTAEELLQGAQLTGASTYHVGLSRSSAGPVMLEDGTTARYLPWAAGEPNGDGACVMVDGTTIKDAPCTTSAPALCAAPLDAHQGHCPDGWLAVGSRCVQTSDSCGDADWATARGQCRAMGAELWAPSTVEQLNQLAATVYECPGGFGRWPSLPSACLRREDAELTYAAAQEACFSMGGRLMTVDTPAKARAFNALCGEGNTCMVGMDDMATEGVFRHANGARVGDFTLWMQGHPASSPGADDCVHQAGMRWYNVPCSSTAPSVCEVGFGAPTVAAPSHKEYWLSGYPASWDDARAKCRSTGGDLAAVHNAEDEERVRAACGSWERNNLCWVGLRTAPMSRTFRWVGGVDVAAYSNWDDGEPNNSASDGGAEECGAVLPASLGGGWNDAACSLEFLFVCEYDTDVSTAPTSVEDTQLIKRVVYGDFTYPEAVSACRARGGDIASIRDSTELSHAKWALWLPSPAPVWIGLTDADAEGSFVWHDGLSLAQTGSSWADNEPSAVDSDAKDCVVMNAPSKWATTQCDGSGTTAATGALCDIPASLLEARADTMSSYLVHIPGAVDQPGAAAKCHAIGGSLFAMRHSADFESTLELCPGTCWLGYVLGDEYRLPSLTPITYSNWAAGEPSGGLPCIVSVNGVWHASACDDVSRSPEALCELPVFQPRETFARLPEAPFSFLKAHPGSFTYEEAKAKCASGGGALAVLDTRMKMEMGQAVCRGSWCWIGLDDLAVSDTFVWGNGSPLGAHNWGFGEPNDAEGGESCAQIWTDGQWNDFPCDLVGGDPAQMFALCEYSSAPSETRGPRDVSTPGVWVDASRTAQLHTTAECPAGFGQWSSLPSTCLRRVDEALTYAAAQEVCFSMGGRLMSVDSAEKARAFDTLCGEGNTCMLGMDDIATEGVFRHANGARVGDFTLWTDNNPSALFQAEDCVHQTSMQWSNVLCSATAPSVCEVSSRAPTVAAPSHKEYWLSGYPASWDDARAKCRSTGGDLAAVHNAEDEERVRAACGSWERNNLCWVGLRTAPMSRTFRWVGGVDVAAYSNWDDGEPNNSASDGGAEECGAVLPASLGGGWNDAACSLEFLFVCEYDTDVSTAPTSVEDTQLIKRVVYGDFTYPEAVSACRARGGDIASIRDSTELSHAKWALWLPSPAPVWIGLTDADAEGSFVWHDGLSLAQTGSSWADNEPSAVDSDAKDCVVMNAPSKWATTQCDGSGTTAATGALCDIPASLLEARADTMSSYLVHIPGAVDQPGAAAKCHAIGGSLFAMRHSADFESTLELCPGTCWLGYVLGDEYRLPSLTPITYSNWAAGEPSGGLPCIVSVNGVWHASACDDVSRSPEALCELPVFQPRETFARLPEAPFSFLKAHPGSFTYEEAKAKCASGGGALAVLDTRMKMEMGQAVCRGSWCWIGLDDLEVSDTFVWGNGSPLGAHNWGFGEPSDAAGAESCVHIWNDGQWNDFPCDLVGGDPGQMFALCEYSSAPSEARGPYTTPAAVWAGASPTASRSPFMWAESASVVNLAWAPVLDEGNCAWFRSDRSSGVPVLQASDCSVPRPFACAFADVCAQHNPCKNGTVCKSVGLPASAGGQVGYTCSCPTDDSSCDTGDSTASCPDGWSASADNPNTCFQALATPMAWADAEAACVAAGGNLATVTSQAELNQVSGMAASSPFHVGVSISPAGGHVLMDGTAATFLPWSSAGQHSYGSCVAAATGAGFTRVMCATPLPAVCSMQLDGGRGTCPAGWRSVGSRCVRMSSADGGDGLTLHDAHAQCKALGADLVAPTTPARRVELTQPDCPSGFTRHPTMFGSCLHRVDGSMSYTAAQAACAGIGARLVAENTAGAAAAVDVVCGSGNACWIGLDNRVAEGAASFTFSNGERLGSFSFWATGQPDDGSGVEDCVVHTSGTGWSDSSCDTQHAAVCEIVTDATTFSRPTYRRFPYAAVFDTARAVCQAAGGDLATVRDDLSAGRVAAACGMDAEDTCWIGLRAKSGAQSFRWVSGDGAVTRPQWASSGPTATGNCVVVKGTEWSAESCTARRAFVCEFVGDDAMPRVPESMPRLVKKTVYGDFTYTEAKAYCRNTGGDLATFRTVTDYYDGFASLGQNMAWVGLDDIANEGTYVWADGTVHTTGDYFPDNTPLSTPDTFDCVHMDNDFIQTRDCADRLPAMCEYPAHLHDVLVSPSATYFHQLPGTMTQTEAQSACLGAGGELAKITSAVEAKTALSACPGTCWLSYTDVDVEGEFRAWDGSVPRFTYWAAGAPNNADGDGNPQHCVVATAGEWDDVACTSSHASLCQLPVGHGDGTLPQLPVEPYSYLDVVLQSPMTHADAQKACADGGGRLAVLDTDEKLQVGAAVCSGMTCWLGLDDYETEGTFVWGDGTVLTDTLWVHGQPDNKDGVERCMHLWHDIHFAGGLVNDLICSGLSQMAALCEYPSQSQPRSPASAGALWTSAAKSPTSGLHEWSPGRRVAAEAWVHGPQPPDSCSWMRGDGASRIPGVQAAACEETRPYACEFANACASNPCQNGGTCSLQHNSTDRHVVCTCPDGFSGQLCEIGGGSAGSCPAGFATSVVSDDTCILGVSTAMTWAAADQYCRARGGHLMTFDNAAEYSQASSLIGGSGTFHVGFVRSRTSGWFVDAYGEPPLHAPWGTGEPGWQHDCVAASLSAAALSVGDCAVELPFACRYEKQQHRGRCPAGWVSVGSRCLRSSRASGAPAATWYDAQAQCQAHGASLATPRHGAAQALVTAVGMGDCPTNYTRWPSAGNKCLRTVRGQFSHTQAQDACVAAGGRLASLMTAGFDAAAEALCTDVCRIGLADSATEGTMLYARGQQVGSCSNWGGWEPDNLQAMRIARYSTLAGGGQTASVSTRTP